MKHGMLTIFRKELARFFGDRRMAFTTIILPGLLIFVLYNFMGSALTKQFSVDEDFKPVIHVVNLPNSLSAPTEGIELIPVPAADADGIKAAITEQGAQVLAVFPAGFDGDILTYDPADGGPSPAVELYYNSADMDSYTAYQAMYTLLDALESSMTNRFDVNPGVGDYDLATEEDTAGTIFASMLPMLLMMFLFSGCMSVAPESIAGEKERGTIATLLVTPLKRSHLALGKICALSVVALLSGAFSTLGTMSSLPKLMQLDGGIAVPYGPVHYLSLAAVILATVLLIVAAISIISAYARSVKEAQGYITPLMIIVTLIGITAMFGGGAQQGALFYLIPFYNTVQAMVGIFSFQVNALHLALTVCANLVYTGVCVFVLTRMFNSEKVMFQR